MKITKKTTLLAGLKRVTIDYLDVNLASDVTLKGTNLEGIDGYYEDDNLRCFAVTLRSSHGGSANVMLSQNSGGYWTGRTSDVLFSAGDEATVSVTTNPSKREWKQETVSKTVTVSE